MDPIENQTSSVPPSRGPLFYIGAVGLMAVMVIETLAVIGRHTGWPLLGALEIIQAAVLLAACASMVTATLTNAHASVHLLVDRMPPRWSNILLRAGAILSALFFAGLAAGSVWLVGDFWDGHEESELLGIPIRPLRILSAITAGTLALLFAYRAVRSKRA